MNRSTLRLVVALIISFAAPAFAQAPVAYRLSFPQPEHHWMEVEVTFADVPAGTLEVRMSRSSPGRYALHEFAKNVYDVHAADASGAPLAFTRPNPHEWDVPAHKGTVRVSYKVFGDRVDGTYLAIDRTHAHINMPAALMWARGLERRPVTVRFEQPPGESWRVGTQLYPGADAQTFTAPNMQYLMDSPAELSAFTMRTFTVDVGPRPPTFRIVLHHEGADAEVDAYARDTQRITREARAIFGEFPAFERDTYTFIADYVPWASGDGMEHRNSTVLTSTGSLRAARLTLLDTLSHEFFHAWNIERIRPRSLEPFNFDDENMSGELWFGEGFTSYYGPLILHRAGLTDLTDFSRTFENMIDVVVRSPARRIRSAEEMSQLAPFVDAASAIDRTNFENTFMSYYTWGAVIGLGLDLTLRDRTDGRITLDDFMRAMWQQFGKSGERVAGYVEKPYTMSDLTATLAAVSGDAPFAADFFARYIQGHDVVDYARLLRRAGLVLRPRRPGAPFAGDLHLQGADGGVRVVSTVPAGSPWHDAGIERDDVIVSVANTTVRTTDDLHRLIQQRRPGDVLAVVFQRRGGRNATGTLRLVEDPRLELVPAESVGQPFTDAQRRFRHAWLSSRQRPAQLLIEQPR
jgi:predicted metalloprotease with PDZ domain